MLSECWKTTPVSDVNISDMSRAKTVNMMKIIPLGGIVVQIGLEMGTVLPHTSYVL
jgi:hypothetical protein